MTLEQLRIFVAVAEREHVTQGAQALNLTQSATSAAIAALEERHGARLFDRVGRRIALTETGRLFLIEARAVLARAVAAETVLADLAGLKRGALHLAASQTVANYWLPSRIHRFQTRYPGIAVSLIIGNSETVAAAIHSGGADIGLIEGQLDDPALSIQPIGEDVLALVVAPSHPWAKAAPNPIDWTGTRWVLREKGSGTRALLEEALAAHGQSLANLDIALELPANEAVRTAVEAGAGATVMSTLVVQASLDAKTLVAVPVTLPRRSFYALRHKERYATHAQDAFYAML